MSKNSLLTILVIFTATAMPAFAGAQSSGTTQPQESESERIHRLLMEKWQVDVNEATARQMRAGKLWYEGHRQEGLSMMLVAHQDLCALSNAPEGEPFDQMSGLMLAQMYVQLDQVAEAYLYYRKANAMIALNPTALARRPDVRMSFFEVCTALKRTEEAGQAFQAIAKGDRFNTYMYAGFSALKNSRFEEAGRWLEEAVKIRPEDAVVQEELARVKRILARKTPSHLG